MRLNVTTGHGRNSLVEFNNIETLPLKVKILQVYCGFDHVLLFSDSNIIQSKRMCFIYSITVVLHFPLTPHRSTVLMASSVRTKTEKKTLSGLASAECSGWEESWYSLASTTPLDTAAGGCRLYSVWWHGPSSQNI